MTIWQTLCSFGTFFQVWVLRKSGNPGYKPGQVTTAAAKTLFRSQQKNNCLIFTNVFG
jgi:hypothetical protein